jgi:predicted dehydrogenase
MIVAIIGAGLMGRWHAHAARRAGATVRWVVDSDVARATKLASATGSTAAGSLEDVLRARPPDVVHICTPPPTHGTLARQSFEAGAHAIVEKPLAGSLSETRELIKLAIQRGVLELGARIPTPQVLAFRSLAFSAGGASHDGHERDEIALEILPHHLALAAKLTGRPMAAVEWAVHRPAAGELHITGLADGAHVSISISLAARPTRNEVELFAEEASGYADLFHGFAIIESGGVGRTQKVWRPFGRNLRQVGAASVNLARRIVTGEPAYPGLRALLRAAYRSCEQRTEWPIPARLIEDESAARDNVREAWLAYTGSLRGAQVVR